MFQKVLVPLDGSTRAEQALPMAASLARASGGLLVLVRVVSPPIDYSGGLALIPLMTGQIIESEMKEAADYLTSVVARPHLAGIASTTEVRYGFPAQQVSEAAQIHGCDLIVLCSHGRTGVSRWALGSVAHTLVHQSTVPILVLRQEEAPAHEEAARPFWTLVPLDGSELAEAALTPALALTTALAGKERGGLHLMQVVKDAGSAEEEDFASALNGKAYQLARSYLTTMAERTRATGPGRTLAVTFSVERAPDVASTLLAAAEQEGPVGCDLIAISTHGRSGLQRLVIGSVTERLLDTTHLPMLIVRPPQQA